ncbi:MAG: TRAP transporter substrate-binding protein [Burkholderiales bacterium]|nr:TRAP transporter substrate-binding protein [Burkholderiales bacterium]
MSIKRRSLLVGSAASAGLAGFPAIVRSQEKFEVKVANFVGPQHFQSQWLVKWGEALEKRSNGRLVFKHFPGAQMGPTPKHFDFARDGTAEIAYILHGATPGRFALTELVNLPYLIGSAEIGIKVLNDPELRAKYLDAEHRGTKVLYLFTHQPGSVHTTKKAVRSLDDFKGLRLRFATPAIREFIQQLGATPVGVPPTEVAEQLQKGTLDGAFTDYGGAGIAWKLGGIVKHTTEMYCFVASFAIVANEAWFNKLPADLQRMVTESVTGIEKEIGSNWDALDAPGKKALMDGGGEAIRLSKAEDDRLRAIGAQVTENTLKAMEGRNLPARQVFAMMKSLAERHAKTSKSFWS